MPVSKTGDLSAPATMLDGWMGLLYRRRFNLLSAAERKASPDYHAQFVKSLQSDKSLSDAAKARLAQLESLAANAGGQLERRCIISATHLDTLRRALGA